MIAAAGNRSPLGVYIHAARLLEDTTGARTQQLKQFIEYASGFDNVWFATVTQVGGSRALGIGNTHAACLCSSAGCYCHLCGISRPWHVAVDNPCARGGNHGIWAPLRTNPTHAPALPHRSSNG